jgi:phytoene dehydrogenase-like protein
MPAELSEFLLLVSAVLVLAAFFARRLLRRRGRAALGNIVSIVLAVGGVALAGWVGWLHYAPPLAAVPAPPSVVNAAAEAAPLAHAEPVPTAIAALQECTPGTPPAAAPDGSKASLEQMVAARTAFQQYDAATNTFTQCVDQTIERVIKQFPQASAADLETLNKLRNGAHNTAIEQEQAFADQLNAQVRAFKAKHPSP